MSSDLPDVRVQYPAPREDCPICLDERQYVGWGGQQWTTMAELAAGHRNELREEEPACSGSASSRRSRSASGRCWSAPRPATCCGTASPCSTTRAASGSPRLGGIAAICMSHPHFYGANVEWADAFEARILHPAGRPGVDPAAVAADRAVRRPGRAGARPDRRPDRRPLRRRRGAALAGRDRRPWRAAHRGHDHRRARTVTG